MFPCIIVSNMTVPSHREAIILQSLPLIFPSSPTPNWREGIYDPVSLTCPPTPQASSFVIWNSLSLHHLEVELSQKRQKGRENINLHICPRRFHHLGGQKILNCTQSYTYMTFHCMDGIQREKEKKNGSRLHASIMLVFLYKEMCIYDFSLFLRVTFLSK